MTPPVAACTSRIGSFVRIALEHGASLVPVFTFGENEMFKQLLPNPPDSPVRRVQELLKNWLSFSMPVRASSGARWNCGVGGNT